MTAGGGNPAGSSSALTHPDAAESGLLASAEERAASVTGLGPYGTVAVTFIFLTLVALLVVPLLVNRRVVDLRRQIEASEPARTATNRLQFSLARQMSSLGELLLTRDRTAATAFRTAQADERAVYAELDSLVGELGPEVETEYREVRALAARWHALAADEEVFDEQAAVAIEELVPRERGLFEELLQATGQLDRAILRSTAATRTRIARAENAGLSLTVALAILALVAAGFVATLAVRTQRLAAEASRRRALAEAALEETARAQRARERLIRGITHDVKNPLGAARGYAQLLSLGVKAPIHPAQAPLLEGVHRSINNALAIIADLLDVARADSGGLSMHPVRISLTALVADTVTDHRGAAEAAGHQIELSTNPRSITLETDPVRVRQILDNLLSNAIKYTPPPGRIRVVVEALRDVEGGQDGDRVAVRVIDSGPGIPQGLREKIFDEFTRVDDRSSLKGHGLGLAIARRLARLLGGELEAAERSEPGAEFVLWLPGSSAPSR